MNISSLLVLLMMLQMVAIVETKALRLSAMDKRRPEMLDSLSKIPLKMIQLGKRSYASSLDGFHRNFDVSIESDNEDSYETGNYPWNHRSGETRSKLYKRRPEMLNSLSRVPLRMIQLG
ncbi:hypothetical protein ACOME3_003054 [Neoechinorhynchus agilis]